MSAATCGECGTVHGDVSCPTCRQRVDARSVSWEQLPLDLDRPADGDRAGGLGEVA